LTVWSDLAQTAERLIADILGVLEVPASLVVCWAATDELAVPLDVVDVRLEAVGPAGALDDSDYLVKHISTFLRLAGDVLVVFSSLVVCWATADELAVPLDVIYVRLEAVGLAGAPDDSDYLVKHISTFLRLNVDALVVFASLVVCRAADLAALLDVVHVRLEAVGPVGAPEDSDYLVKHILFPSSSTL